MGKPDLDAMVDVVQRLVDIAKTEGLSKLTAGDISFELKEDPVAGVPWDFSMELDDDSEQPGTTIAPEDDPDLYLSSG